MQVTQQSQLLSRLAQDPQRLVDIIYNSISLAVLVFLRKVCGLMVSSLASHTSNQGSNFNPGRTQIIIIFF